MKIFLFLLCFFYIPFVQASACKDFFDQKFKDQVREFIKLAGDGHIKNIKFFISQNPLLVNVSNAYGETPLMHTAHNGHIDIVNLFIELGANINLQSSNPLGPTTALVEAAHNGHRDIVKILREKGADVNALNGLAFREAAKQGHTDIAQDLIDAGANMYLKDGFGFTSLHYASGNGHTDIVVKILPEKKFNSIPEGFIDAKTTIDIAPGEFQETAFQLAVKNGHTNTAKILREKGANINIRDGFGNTALIRTISEGHIETSLFLIDIIGVDIQAQNGFGNTALFEAAYNGYTDISDALVKAGANINVKNSVKMTPFIAAANNGHIDIVKILAEKEELDINAKDVFNQTALSRAAYNGFMEIVKIIEEAKYKRRFNVI